MIPRDKLEIGLIEEFSKLPFGEDDSLFSADKRDEGVGSPKLDKLLTKRPLFHKVFIRMVERFVLQKPFQMIQNENPRGKVAPFLNKGGLGHEKVLPYG